MSRSCFAALEHIGDRLLAGEELAADVDFVDAVEFFFGYLLKGLGEGQPGVIEQSIQPAQELHRFIDHPAAIGNHANIGLKGDRPAAHAFDLLYRIHGALERCRCS